MGRVNFGDSLHCDDDLIFNNEVCAIVSDVHAKVVHGERPFEITMKLFISQRHDQRTFGDGLEVPIAKRVVNLKK